MKFILIILFVIFLLFSNTKSVEKFSKKNNKCPEGHEKQITGRHSREEATYTERNKYRCIPKKNFSILLNKLNNNKEITCSDEDDYYNCHTSDELLKLDGDYFNAVFSLKKICDENKCRKLNKQEQKSAIKNCKDVIENTFGDKSYMFNEDNTLYYNYIKKLKKECDKLKNTSEEVYLKPLSLEEKTKRVVSKIKKYIHRRRKVYKNINNEVLNLEKLRKEIIINLIKKKKGGSDLKDIIDFKTLIKLVNIDDKLDYYYDTHDNKRYLEIMSNEFLLSLSDEKINKIVKNKKQNKLFLDILFNDIFKRFEFDRNNCQSKHDGWATYSTWKPYKECAVYYNYRYLTLPNLKKLKKFIPRINNYSILGEYSGDMEALLDMIIKTKDNIKKILLSANWEEEFDKIYPTISDYTNTLSQLTQTRFTPK